MSLNASIQGISSGNGAEVDTNHRLQVNLASSATPSQVGAVCNFSEIDDGSISGTPLLRSAQVSPDYRLRTGVDTLLFADIFNSTAQNISLYKYAFTTMTMTMSSGFLNVNAAGTSTVAGNYAYLQTQRYFQLIDTAPLCIEFIGQFDRMPIANEVFLCGFGVATGAVEPVDGCWFELTSNGLVGCSRYNSGVVTKTGTLVDTAEMSVNTNGKYCIVVTFQNIEFQVNQKLYAVLAVPNAQGTPFLSVALPVFIQKYNNALVGSSPNMKIQISNLTVLLRDIATNMTWPGQMALLGLSNQQINGGTARSSAMQWANTTLPTAAAATNTTAALGAFFGGIFQMNAPAKSATDVIIASYLNPIGGVNQTPRTLKIKGIRVDCVNSVVAVATTATVFAVSVAQGGTTLTLDQVETASFATGTVKGARIQPMGVISFPLAAPVGAVSPTIQFDFEAPLVINPGEYVQVIAKILVGTATSTEVFQWIISPNFHYE